MPFARFIFAETSPSAAGTAASSQPVDSSANYLPPGVAGPLDDYDSLDIVAELTGATGGTLDVYVQSNPDGQNQNWFDIAHFTQLAAAAAAVKYNCSISLFTNATAPTVVGKNLSPALAANTMVQGPFSDRIRVLMVAGTGTSAGAAVRVTVCAQRSRLREFGGS